MTEHDPLCPVFKYPGQICECFFIGKARADQSERIAQAIEALDPRAQRFGDNDAASEMQERAARRARNMGKA